MSKVTPKNINDYITMIRINFENAYSTHNDTERQMLIKSWFAILKDYPKEVCDTAVITAIKHAKFAPRIGDIVEQIEKMQEAFQKTKEDLWGELNSVLRKVSNNTYAYRFNAIDSNGKTQGENAKIRNEKIFANLSPELKEYCRDVGGLAQIAEYTDAELTYERGRFMKAVPDLRTRARIRQDTPEIVAGLLRDMPSGLALGSGNAGLLEGGEKK